MPGVWHSVSCLDQRHGSLGFFPFRIAVPAAETLPCFFFAGEHYRAGCWRTLASYRSSCSAAWRPGHWLGSLSTTVPLLLSEEEVCRQPVAMPTIGAVLRG